MTLTSIAAAAKIGGLRPWGALVVAASAPLLFASCTFESELSGAECEREDALAEDGTTRCRNGFWVALDGAENDGSPDTRPPPRDTEEGDGDDDDGGCDSPPTWYRDSDGDGRGTEETTRTSCSQPEGFVGRADDCDDRDDAINPGASETCDGVDEDCDGSTDENDGGDPLTDGCGPGTTDGVCERVTRTCQDGDWEDPDCDGATYPSTEFCDDRDNDCNGKTDETGCTNFGASCTDDADCVSGKCNEDESSCTQAIFVTQSKYDGALGGTDGADKKCNEAASKANLGGDWIAVVADSNNGALNRTDVTFPLYNRRGEAVATSQEDLWDNDDQPSLESAIRYDQFREIHDVDVWTGTTADGDENNYCSDSAAWNQGTDDANGTTGRSDATDGNWVHETDDRTCDQTAALYCIEKVGE